MHHHDHGEGAAAFRRQRHVRVERNAVERRHALFERFGGAEADAVLRFARVSEGRRFGERHGWRRERQQPDRQHANEVSPQTMHPAPSE